MNPIITVIIPVYNVEEYLRECIESILGQSYSNLEIILVDDGSTDCSGNICDYYSSIDSRVKVIHKENGGLSNARNVAIDVCVGEYITFVDSDDIIYQKYVEYLYEQIITNCADIASTNLFQFYDKKEIDVKIEYSSVTISNLEAARKMLNVDGFSSCACAKLYKRELFDDIRFPEGRLYEDYLTIYKVLSMAKRITLLNNKMYYYRQRPGSIMRSNCSDQTVTLINAAREVTSYILKEWPELEIEALADEVAQCLKCLQRIINYDPNSYLDKQKEIFEIVNSNKRKLLWSFKTSPKLKVKILSLELGKSFFIKIYNKFDGTRKI